MRVFLLGATGYIGHIIAEKLQAAGHEVVGLARSDEAAATLRSRDITPHWGDLNDPASLQAGARSADGVIHAAQERFNPAMTNADLQRMLLAGVAATDAILDALADTGKPFIWTGGIGGYASAPGQTITEDTPVLQVPEMQGFIRQENAVLSAGTRGVRGIAIRPGIVYGRAQVASSPITLWLTGTLQSRRAVIVGDGSNIISTVHVDDLGELYVKALENAPAGTLLNAVAPDYPQMRQIMQAISELAGLGGEVESITPDEAFQIMGFGARLAMYDMRVSSERAQTLLGWQPHFPSVTEELKHGSYAALAGQLGQMPSMPTPAQA